MVPCLVTLTDLYTRRGGLTASAEFLLYSLFLLSSMPSVVDHVTSRVMLTFVTFRIP